MKTKKVTISERVIKSYLGDREVYQLRDKNLPLILRFKKDRTGGMWYAVNYKKDAKRMTKIANWPLVSTSLVKKLLPQYIGSKEKVNVDHFQTIKELVSWHLETIEIKGGITESRKRQTRVAVNKHLIPLVGDLEIKAATKKEIFNRLIKPMLENYKVSTIKKTFGVLRHAITSSHRLDLVPDCTLFNLLYRDFKLPKPDVRQARLTIGDIPELMEKLKHYSVTKEKALVMMMLYHGTRVTETALAEWNHIDLKNGVWTIPAKNTKTRVEIKIPLTPHAYGLLKDWHNELISKRKYRGKYIFPATIRTHLSDNPINEAKRHELIKMVSNGDWTAHDTRKCCATSWLEMGFDFFVIECQLNHIKDSQVSAYFQTEIFNRRKAMLEHWHKFLNF
ncbi:integrase [Vibrio phage CKB-S2]|nr:integrase [Vibrio phage CKB-S2]